MSHKVFALAVLGVIVLGSFRPVGAGEDQDVELYLPLVRSDTNDLAGGIVMEIETSPGLPNVMLASLVRSYYDWLSPRYSLDRGLTWHKVESVPGNNYEIRTLGIAIAPNPDQRPRFLMTVKTWYGANLYRSDDLGNSWVRVDIGSDAFPDGEGGFSNLIASPADPSHLFLAYSILTSGWEPLILGYAYASENEGTSWYQVWGEGLEKAVDVILPSPSVAERAYFRIYDMNSFYRDYWEMMNGEVWNSADNFPNTTYNLALDAVDPDLMYSIEAGRSTDGGNTWTPWVNPPCSFWRLITHPTRSRALYVLCDGGLFRSKSSGNRWRQLSTNGEGVLFPDYSVPGRLIWVKSDGVWVSCDDGLKWLLINPGCTRTAILPSGVDLDD